MARCWSQIWTEGCSHLEFDDTSPGKTCLAIAFEDTFTYGSATLKFELILQFCLNLQFFA